MSRNNDVFQILVASNTQAVLPAGSTPSALGVNQIGVFDYHTNLSIDGTGNVKDFYIAVGNGSPGSTEVTSLRKSSGQKIQRNNIEFYAYRPHTPGRPQIDEITGYETVKCDTEYGIKFELRNQAVYARGGYNQYSKFYSVNTSCCPVDSEDKTGNSAEVTRGLVNAINADSDTNFMSAEAFTVGALLATDGTVSQDYDAGEALTSDDLDAIVEANTGQPSGDQIATGFRVTTENLGFSDFDTIKMGYYNTRGTVLITSLTEGFKCTGKVNTTQELVFAEGVGYDLKQKEYFAGGWNGRPGPYRVNSVTGLARDGEFMYQVNGNANYDVVALTYDHEAISGWRSFESHLATEIAFETTDGGATTGRDSFLIVIDRLVASLGLDAKADDATASNDDPEVVERTTDKTPATDGLD